MFCRLLSNRRRQALVLVAVVAVAVVTAAAQAGPRHPVSGRVIAQVMGYEGASWLERPEREREEAPSKAIEALDIKTGQVVADVGAGSGYYTVRLADRVGARGRVLAEDIDAEARDRLAQRVLRERLDNVSVRLGTPDDPRLPENSFDRIFMVHMYHEVEEPYAFLWRLRPALRERGQVVVVDIDRPTDEHGIAPQLLFCEFEAVGFRLAEFVRKPELAGYYAQFEAVGPRPQPHAITPCGEQGQNMGTAPE